MNVLLNAHDCIVSLNNLFLIVRLFSHKMDNFMSKILPKKVWSVVFGYLQNFMLFGGTKFPVYEYVENTFAKNISYIKNNNTLGPSAAETMELETITAELLLCDWENKRKLEKILTAAHTHHDLVITIIKKDNVGVLKYICDYGGLNEHTMAHYRVWELVGEYGSFEILRYLVKNHTNTTDKINGALTHVCKYGYLKTAKLLIQKFRLNRTQIYAPRDKRGVDIRTIYQLVCENGHYEMLEYLRQAFKLKRYDLNIFNIFKHAIREDDMTLAKYITGTFNLTSRRAMRWFNIIKIYQHANRVNHNKDTEITKYIRETFKLTRDQISLPVVPVALNKQAKIMDYFREQFKLYSNIHHLP